jgi:hypothetical protein
MSACLKPVNRSFSGEENFTEIVHTVVSSTVDAGEKPNLLLNLL